MTTAFIPARHLRLAALLAAGLVIAFAAVSGASAQDAYRDRGDRYSRAQADDTSRARTRSDDNTRMERPRTQSVRRSDDGFRGDSGRSSFEGRFDRDRSDSRFESRFDRDRFDSGFDSRSRITVGLSTHSYSAPVYSRYDYTPHYRTVEYRAPYTSYRPAYRFDFYEPRYDPYCPPPVPRIIYSTTYYGYRPLGSTYRPVYGVGYGHYPRYSYPRTSISFGLRYDYRR